MELFTRDLVLSGPLTEVRNWAAGVAQAFGEATGRTPNVWTSVAGGTAGHYSWGMQVDGAAEIIELTMIALADESYLSKVEEGRHLFTDQPRDTIYRPFTEMGEDRTRPGNVASITTAVASAGSLGDAVGWGIEINEYVQRLTGMYSVVLGTAAGGFSTLTWMGIAKDAEQADEADRKLQQDEGYLKLIARGGPYFQDGSANTQIFLRIA